MATFGLMVLLVVLAQGRNELDKEPEKAFK